MLASEIVPKIEGEQDFHKDQSSDARLDENKALVADAKTKDDGVQQASVLSVASD